MTDENWDLWFEYQSEKDAWEAQDREEFALYNPGQEYVALTDEEFLLIIRELHVA